MADVVLDKRDDGVALLTLNRPESLNAFGDDLPRLFAEALAECRADASVRCVAITGAGRGIDVESAGSWPAMTSVTRAASATVWVNGPIWSRLLAKATRP